MCMYGRKEQKQTGSQNCSQFSAVLDSFDLMGTQVPTFRASPLTPECDEWCEFPVSDRPDAVRQWLHATEEDPSMILVSAQLLLV